MDDEQKRRAAIALDKAAEAVGSRAELGRLLGISGPAVRQWQVVPAERVVSVERASGIRRQLLRPDLYEDALASVSVS